MAVIELEYDENDADTPPAAQSTATFATAGSFAPPPPQENIRLRAKSAEPKLSAKNF
jgi:hypothetical protein